MATIKKKKKDRFAEAEDAGPKSLVQAIREDSDYKKFKTIVKTTRERLKLEADRKEAMSLHAGRISRSIYGARRFSPKTLLEAEAQEMGNRSRLVEIRVRASNELSVLDEAIKTIRGYISTEYDVDLREFGTVEQRRAMIDRVIKSAVNLKSEGEDFLAMLDTFIKDLDQAGFKLRDCIEILKLLDSSKGKII